MKTECFRNALPCFMRRNRGETPAAFDNSTSFTSATSVSATMSSPIYLRNSLRIARNNLPLRVVSCVSSASSHLSYSTDSNRAESNQSDRVPTNAPSPPSPVPNVSETNAVPTSTWGKQDALLQEDPEAAEHKRQMQAPNRQNVWSRSQERREVAMRGPRFEQTIMELQVCGPLFLSHTINLDTVG